MTMAPITIYVPRDSAALALGADEVAQALVAEATRRKVNIELVRNGSRGLFWLEPLVEVATAQGRVAYGPVQPEDVASLFEAGFHTGGGPPAGPGAHGRHRLSAPPGAPDLRPHGHYRPFVPGRLPGA